MSQRSLRNFYFRHCLGVTFMISLNPHSSLRASTSHFIEDEHGAQRVKLPKVIQLLGG